MPHVYTAVPCETTTCPARRVRPTTPASAAAKANVSLAASSRGVRVVAQHIAAIASFRCAASAAFVDVRTLPVGRAALAVVEAVSRRLVVVGDAATTGYRRRVAEVSTGQGTSELRDLLANLSGQTRSPDRLVFKATRGLVFLEPEELEWVESAGNYLKVHVADEEYLIRETMSAFCNRVDASRFLQIHRSFLVNIKHVRQLRLTGSGTDSEVVLRDGTTLAIGRSYRDAALQRFGSQS